MKRQYMKPTMRVVKLRKQHSLLIGSNKLQMYTGDGNQVTDEKYVW